MEFSYLFVELGFAIGWVGMGCCVDRIRGWFDRVLVVGGERRDRCVGVVVCLVGRRCGGVGRELLVRVWLG